MSFAEQFATATKDTEVTTTIMKAITTKEFVSLVIIAITAPLFALALVGGVGVLYATGDGFFLLALTLCGVVVSGINGFGRRTVAVEPQSRKSRRGPQSSVALHS